MLQLSVMKQKFKLNSIESRKLLPRFAKWIGRTFIAKKLKNNNTTSDKNQVTSENNENVDVIWINLLYLGTQGDQLLLSLTREITRCLTKKIKFKVTQSTQNLCFYTNIKDEINKLMKLFINFVAQDVTQSVLVKLNKIYVYN